MKPLLVIKYGTACLTDKHGEIEINVINQIAAQLAELNKKYRLILVSSGAVSAGKKFIKDFSGTLSQKKAAAAIGNPILMQTYTQAFAKQDTQVAQALCERQHFSSRSQFLQLPKTFEVLWENNIIPILNENDVTSDPDLKFSDNDQLAMMLAINFYAEKLLFGTSADGVWDEKKQVIPIIEQFDKRIYSLVRPEEKSAGGLGGMASKLTYADMTTRYGVEAIIFSGRAERGIIESVNGKSGTRCLPQGCLVPARKRWLAVSSVSLGKIIIDEGAATALKKRKSLLSVGSKKVEGFFQKNAVIEIYTIENPKKPIAVAQAEMSSIDMKQKLINQTSSVLAHADKIVLL